MWWELDNTYNYLPTDHVTYLFSIELSHEFCKQRTTEYGDDMREMCVKYWNYEHKDEKGYDQVERGKWRTWFDGIMKPVALSWLRRAETVAEKQ